MHKAWLALEKSVLQAFLAEYVKAIHVLIVLGTLWISNCSSEAQAFVSSAEFRFLGLCIPSFVVSPPPPETKV